MKKVNLGIDDISILNDLYLSTSKLVVNLKDREDFFLKHRYRMYISFAEKQKLSNLPKIPYLHKKRAKIFESLYSSKLSSLNYIKQYRQTTSYKVCSLCGSPAAGTLDHFLPKDIYPELKRNEEFILNEIFYFFVILIILLSFFSSNQNTL